MLVSTSSEDSGDDHRGSSGGQDPGHRGIDVADDQDHTRPGIEKSLLDADHGQTCLFGV